MPGPFFFFAMIIGAVTLVTAVLFVFRPSERRLAILRPLSAATIFSAIAAFLLGIANGLAAYTRLLEQAADGPAGDGPSRLLLGALTESPAPLVIAFALVSVVWLLVAVGRRRQV
ncbi:MAG: hypothetical protein P8Y94_04820 [Acidobacteriota bacterium]